MKIKAIGVSGLLAVAFLLSGIGGIFDAEAVAAGTNDHFASRRAAVQAQAQLQQNLRRWGGPTTGRTWWTPQRGTNHRVVVPNTYYVPGYVPYYPRIYPTYPGYYPNAYSAPTYFPGTYIHIERRIR